MNQALPEIVHYRLSPGVDVVPLPDDAILFRSDGLAVKIEGSMAAVLSRRILPALAQAHSLPELAALEPDVPATELEGALGNLARARVLERKQEHSGTSAPTLLASWVENLGVPASVAEERLRSARVAVLGLDAQGAHLALELARLGIGTCILGDAFEVEERDALSMPTAVFRLGVSRQQAVATAIEALAPRTRLELAPALSRQSVERLAEGASLLIGCFGRRYESAQHWLNRAAISLRKPALFAELGTHTMRLGPAVIAGQTACYMCYRMRRVACETNYDEAMAYERFLNERQRPAPVVAAMTPFLPSHAASVLAGEIFKLIALGIPSRLCGRLLEFDGLTLDWTFHEILRQPECPVCGLGDGPPKRDNPTLDALCDAQQSAPRGELQHLAPRLVSASTGVVRRMEPFVKDNLEPAVPYIVRADVSNHRFVPGGGVEDGVCSGKGVTLKEAEVSALGEAVERYSGAVHARAEVLYARRSELSSDAIDPRELVLYHPSQYPDLPYAPYADNRLGWVTARSLVTARSVLVPALSVFMNYQTRDRQEFLCPITSNGLATGSSLLDSVWAAAREVLERDAFLIAWLNRLPARRFAARGHPDARIAEIAGAYARRGVELRLYAMPTDHAVSVFAAVALDARVQDGPAAVFGLGADEDRVVAARKAVLEVCQVRPSLRRRMRHPDARARLPDLLADPCKVETIDDHDLLYASAAMLPRLGFWLDTAENPFEWQVGGKPSASESLRQLTRWLAERGGDLLYVNLTPPDLKALGLYTARAILPGFQPIDFGWRERRLGGTRVHTLPCELGYYAAGRSHADLNPDPHPLA